MRIVDVIIAKRDSQKLLPEDITHICEQYQNGKIPDYQMSALLMAIYFNGLDEEETFVLTTAMKNSGKTISVPTNNFIVDKHSTGGVGDKISLALSPILAALDVSLVKLSGRGLGHTGGTIDKFESLANFKFNPDGVSLEQMLKACNFALLSYSDDIVPLDKKLYALRDVTGTVQSIPLIASSIMSKKLAVESHGIILDVKVGSGAFMKDLQSAKQLAQTMQKIGRDAGRKVDCVLSDMDQPLGFAVGNALELKEAIDILHGQGPEDVKQLVYILAGLALVQRGDITDYRDGQSIVEKCIKTGKPFEYLKTFVKLCGADEQLLENTQYLTKTQTVNVISNFTNDNVNYVQSIDALAIGNAAMKLGAGRARKDDVINHSVGIVLHKKREDEVKDGQSLACVHYDENTSPKIIENVTKSILQAYIFTENKDSIPNTKIVHEIISS